MARSSFLWLIVLFFSLRNEGCDVILVNADGRVVESGNHAQLIALKGAGTRGTWGTWRTWGTWGAWGTWAVVSR